MLGSGKTNLRARGETGSSAAVGWVARFCQWYYFWAAGWFAITGLVLVLGAFDDTLLEHERLLRRPDSVFGISTKYVLLWGGLFHFVIGAILIFIRDTLIKALLVLWGCSVMAIYGFGSSGAKASVVMPVVTLVADKVGINPKWGGLSWALLLAVLAAGAMLQLGVARWQRKRREAELFVENWQKDRQGKGQFPWAG